MSNKAPADMSLKNYDSFLDNFNIEKGNLISYDCRKKGKVDNFIGFFDLEKFYMEFTNLLTYNNEIRFLDTVGLSENDKRFGNFDDETITQLGEHFESGSNRAGNCFEKRYLFKEIKPGIFEFEIKFEVRTTTNYSPNGWVVAEFELVNRFAPKKEVIVGNDKKIMYGGKWEFRNSYFYYNTLICNYLDTIWFIKDSEKLKEMYLEHIAKESIHADIAYTKKYIIGLLQGYIDNYFKKLI
jgi:hypothetical protein